MFAIAILLALGSPSQILASPIQFQKTHEFSVSASGLCQDLHELQKSLDQWKQTYALDNESNLPKPSIQPNPEQNNCTLNVSYYLPLMFLKFFSPTLILLNPIQEGPNCFASTWRLNGFLATYLQSSSYVRDKDTSRLLEFYSELSKGNACSRVPKPALAQPGDVFIVLNRLKTPTHGFVYIHDQLALSKYGSSGLGAFMMVPPREQAKQYGIDRDEDYQQGRNLLIYRCPALRQVSANRMHYLDNDIGRMWNHYESLAKEIEPHIFSENPIDPQKAKLWERRAKAILEQNAKERGRNALEDGLLLVLRQGLWNLTRVK